MVKSEVAIEVAILQSVLDDNHRLTAEKKYLQERITDLSGELGKKDAHIFSLQSQLKAIKETQKIQSIDCDLITENMFNSPDGENNG